MESPSSPEENHERMTGAGKVPTGWIFRNAKNGKFSSLENSWVFRELASYNQQEHPNNCTKKSNKKKRDEKTHPKTTTNRFSLQTKPVWGSIFLCHFGMVTGCLTISWAWFACRRFALLQCLFFSPVNGCGRLGTKCGKQGGNTKTYLLESKKSPTGPTERTPKP